MTASSCPSNLVSSSSTITRSSPSRSRSSTLLQEREGRPHSGVFSGEEGWSPFHLQHRAGPSSSTSTSDDTGVASGSDSAYGTLDEGDDSCGEGARGAAAAGWKSAAHPSRRARRPTRSRSVGADVFWPAAIPTTSTSSPELGGHQAVFGATLDLDYDADTSFDSVESFQSTSTLEESSTSNRSSPEPSEYEFDLVQSSIRREKRKRLMHRSLDFDEQVGCPGVLSRRHTVPARRRHKHQSTSSSISIVAPSLDLSLAGSRSKTSPSPSAPSSALDLLPTLPTLSPLTLLATSLSLSLSLLSQVSPIPLLPASPVHLLHARGDALLEYTNAFLSPFLISGTSTSALALATVNLASLKALEEEAYTGRRTMTKAVGASLMWVAIVALRVLLSWVFGRVLGWAHPQWFATSAIHEVGSGLAPLLLALSIVRAYSADKGAVTSSSLLQLALLAANFCTPIEQGGTGAWFALSGAVVGLVVCAALFAVEKLRAATSTMRASRSISSRRRLTATSSSFALIGFLLLLPLLSLFVPASPTPSSAALEASFTQLHPQQPHLLTILLMTAPRPGNPDYLLRTITSWLEALPEPGTHNSTSTAAPSTDRVRLIVYTHFATHEVFDRAQVLFSAHPTYATKAAHYVEWARDPRAANRLDQRLHVARGLDFASRSEGGSAYVMLAEDDFPLCPPALAGQGKRRGEWESTWEELQRVLLATNDAMPDFPSLTTTTSTSSALVPSFAEQEASAGHCGLFLATGGSGLIMRGFLAAKLPSLLLGSHDPHGDDRDARAARGEFSVKHEDEGADTPDLVIQDCLRGRLEECRVCAPPSLASEVEEVRTFPQGSRRNGRRGKSGLAGTERLMQRHLGYNASTLPGRKYGQEEWACGWRQPFNGEPDVLTV